MSGKVVKGVYKCRACGAVVVKERQVEIGAHPEQSLALTNEMHFNCKVSPTSPYAKYNIAYGVMDLMVVLNNNTGVEDDE